MHLTKNTVAFLSLLLLLFITSCNLVDGTGEESGESGSDPEPAEEPNKGVIIIRQQSVPAGQPGSFTYTGVPSGTISADGNLVVADLEPGTYTTTEVDPAPDFDVTAVECDDGDSATPSSGDAGSRTAVVNLEAGETVTCTYTNTLRGALVIASQTVPDAVGGSFQYTGSPTGTIPANGTLVVANLEPGTYTSTERDPAPEFDVTAVECDDGASATPSSGDAGSRTAVFNLDPGETVICTFTNTRRGFAVVATQTIPDGAEGNFLFTGVPSGTIPGNGTLVVGNLTPGTYSTTEVDPAPDFELTSVECDDGSSKTGSSGDASTRTAVFNLDPGETVICTFINTQLGVEISPTIAAGSSTGGSGGDSGDEPGGSGGANGVNPFENPDEQMPNFPLPEPLPPGAGTFAAPKPGPWSVANLAGQMDCGSFNMPIPASPTESGVLEVLDGGQTVIGTGMDEAGASITLNAVPSINGRYSGAFEGQEQGVPVTIYYFWQLVTDEHIVGFLTSSATVEGITCTIYRSFEMHYTG